MLKVTKCIKLSNLRGLLGYFTYEYKKGKTCAPLSSHYFSEQIVVTLYLGMDHQVRGSEMRYRVESGKTEVLFLGTRNRVSGKDSIGSPVV